MPDSRWDLCCSPKEELIGLYPEQSQSWPSSDSAPPRARRSPWAPKACFCFFGLTPPSDKLFPHVLKMADGSSGTFPGPDVRPGSSVSIPSHGLAWWEWVTRGHVTPGQYQPIRKPALQMSFTCPRLRPYEVYESVALSIFMELLFWWPDIVILSERARAR